MASVVPKNVEALGDELAIVWTDGAETYLKLKDLRRLCPCASCAGERDLLGRLAKPPARPLTTESFRVTSTAPVGGYALLPAQMHHYAMACGETIVQVHGQSPLQFNYINPNDDPSRNK